MFRAARARRPGRHPAARRAARRAGRWCPRRRPSPDPHRPRPVLRADRRAVRHPRRGGQPHRGALRRARRPRPPSAPRHRRRRRPSRPRWSPWRARPPTPCCSAAVRRLLPRLGRLRGAVAGGPRRHRPRPWRGAHGPLDAGRIRRASWRARCSTPRSWPSAAVGDWRCCARRGALRLRRRRGLRRPDRGGPATRTRRRARLARPRGRGHATLGAGGHRAPAALGPARRCAHAFLALYLVDVAGLGAGRGGAGPGRVGGRGLVGDALAVPGARPPGRPRWSCG